MRYAHVAIPRPLLKSLTYGIPQEMQRMVMPGHRVLIPFHRQQAVGYVISVHAQAPANLDLKKVKEIKEVLDDRPVFSKIMLEFLCWMSGYYCAPIGEVCRSALPSRLSRPHAPRLMRPLVPDETLLPARQPKTVKLTEHQRRAFDVIMKNVEQSKPRPVLLYGITGSGKTEVYLRVFEEIKKLGGEGILLVPEISLTPQLVNQFCDRFGSSVALYHSQLTDAQRLDQWQQIRSGKVCAVIGTRSALFAPFQKLRVIIVDEEHDSSYKQEEGFLYHARDAAVMRARLEGASVILGSATPSIESFANAQSGKYIYCNLPERATGALLPHVEIVDMRENRPQKGSALSASLINAIEETLTKKEQILLLLNRRGFANFLLCQSCGHVFRCPNCAIALTQHKKPLRLLCHYCNFGTKPPDMCPNCSGIDLSSMGGGTQKLEDELATLFPKAVITRLDRDTSSKASMRRTFFKKMQQGEIDILVGTQMIAKGHDFPNVTLVGVVDADVALHLPDFRAFERTFQILTQVAGRAGRAAKAGRVIIQTYQPDHPSIIHAKDHDYASFFEKESEYRQALKYPPYSRIINVKLSGNSEKEVSHTAYAVHQAMKKGCLVGQLEKDIHILGPAPAPLSKIRGKYRWQLLLKAPTARQLALLLSTAGPLINDAVPSGCRIAIDVDPVSML
jgi:primosomal protein N' (replication factor Y)